MIILITRRSRNLKYFHVHSEFGKTRVLFDQQMSIDSNRNNAIRIHAERLLDGLELSVTETLIHPNGMDLIHTAKLVDRT